MDGCSSVPLSIVKIMDGPKIGSYEKFQTIALIREASFCTCHSSTSRVNVELSVLVISRLSSSRCRADSNLLSGHPLNCRRKGAWSCKEFIFSSHLTCGRLSARACWVVLSDSLRSCVCVCACASACVRPRAFERERVYAYVQYSGGPLHLFISEPFLTHHFAL